MDRINEFRLIQAIVDHGSLTGAASQLNLTRSAVSKQLRSLEDRLGVKLVDRSTKSLAMTPPGQMFYQKAQQILEAVAELEESLQADQEQAAGRLHVSVPKVLVNSQYLQRMVAFFQQHPQLRLDLSISDQIDDLIDQRIDFALRVGSLDDSRLYAKPLGETHTIVCASPEYIQSAPDIGSFADALNHRLLLPSYLNWSSSPLWQRFKQLYRLENSHLVDDVQAIVELAKQGMGVAILLEVAAEKALASGELVRLFPELTLGVTPISLVYSSQRYVTKRAELFKAFFK